MRAKTSGFTLPAISRPGEEPTPALGVCFPYELAADGGVQLSGELRPFSNASPQFIPGETDVELDEREGKLWLVQMVK